MLSLAAFGLAGCTSGSQAPAQSSAAAATLAASEAASGDTALPDPPTATPATTAGNLSSADLPTAAALGTGWALRVEGGDAEDGVGNGTAYQERPPSEIVETTVPMGCEVRSTSPIPAHVLQATYRHKESGAYAVVLRMSFATEAEAREFVKVRQVDLARCKDQPDDPYSGEPAPVRRVGGTADQTVATYRQVGESALWYTLARVDGSDVITLDTDPPQKQLITWESAGFASP